MLFKFKWYNSKHNQWYTNTYKDWYKVEQRLNNLQNWNIKIVWLIADIG